MAGADQLGDKKAQAAQIAAKLDADNTRINQLSEQFDGARLHQQQVQTQLASAQSDLARTDGQAQALRSRLRGVAIGAYLRSGQPLAPALADQKDISLATVGAAYQELAAGNERDLLDAMQAVRATLAAQRAQLEAASQDAAAAAASVAQLERTAKGAVADEQVLLSQVNGELATLVAQAQAARQAQLAAQVQAELAARPQPPAPRAQSPAVLAVSTGPLLPRPNPAPTPGPRPVVGPPSPAPPPPAAPPPSSRAGIAVATAEAQLGKPYQFGGAGPDSFDCSGLTMFAWAAAGVSLPHYTGAQYAMTTHIALSQLQPGDLVFFYGDLSHVGLYVGGGTMIHAPHTGTVVSYASIYDMGTSEIYAARVS